VYYIITIKQYYCQLAV